MGVDVAAPPCRIGIVGAGAIVQKVHLPVLANLPDIALGWIADRDEARAHRVARAFGIARVATGADPAAWPDCDLVLLATPLHARAPFLAHYAQRGVPLFAEKPFAADAAEHESSLAAFGATPVFCGYMRRSYAQLRMLRRLVSSGCLGTPQRIRYAEGGRTTSGGGSPTLDLDYRQGGGVLRDLGCHGLDAILFLSGANAHTVEQAAIEWDSQTDRHVEAQLRLHGDALAPAGCAVRFTVSWLAPQPNTLEIDFERASLRCGLKPGAEALLAPEGDFARAIPFALDAGGARGEYASYGAEWEDVLHALRTRTAGEYAAASGLHTTRLVEAIYRAGGAP